MGEGKRQKGKGLRQAYVTLRCPFVRTSFAAAWSGRIYGDK